MPAQLANTNQDYHRYALTTSDGELLTCCRFEPVSEARTHVVIAPAMGVEQAFYRSLASWLQQQGFRVTTFDYRGMGMSKHRPLGQYHNDLLDWATEDCAAVLASVELSSTVPIVWLGHSLGGQIFPLIDGIQRVSKVVTVASGTGYWRHNAPSLRKKVWWFWFLFVPVLLKLYPYFPGKKIGMVGDLPKAVMKQWRRWCLHPDYCVGAEQEEVAIKFENTRLPIRSIAFEDDEMLSDRNIRRLFELFGSQDKTLETLAPTDTPHSRIGHMGFFRSHFQQSLWPDILLPHLND